MAEMDLLEQVRMQDTYERLTKIVDQVSNLGVFPPLVWVWTWDIVVDLVKNHEPGVDDEYVVEMPLEDIFQMFWSQSDKNGFTLEYGAEDCYESIRDWMIDEDILVYIEEPEDEEEDE